jgi:polyphosphate kinase
VRSIVGRFLEHSRIYKFENGGDPLVYLASADWMPRNFYRRVETCFPVEDAVFKKQITDALELYWTDTSKARELGADGIYKSFAKGGRPPVNVQDELLARVPAEGHRAAPRAHQPAEDPTR